MEAKELAKILIDKGLVTEKDIYKLMVTKELKDAAIFLHGIACDSVHGPDVACKFYDEESSSPDPWTCTFHAVWLAKCISIMEAEHISPNVLVIGIQNAVQYIHTSTPESRRVTHLILNIMEADETQATPDDQQLELDALMQKCDDQDTSDECQASSSDNSPDSLPSE